MAQRSHENCHSISRVISRKATTSKVAMREATMATTTKTKRNLRMTARTKRKLRMMSARMTVRTTMMTVRRGTKA